jgi:hypothetical protein
MGMVQIVKLFGVDLFSLSVGLDFHVWFCELFVNLEFELSNIFCEILEGYCQASFG